MNLQTMESGDWWDPWESPSLNCGNVVGRTPVQASKKKKIASVSSMHYFCICWHLPEPWPHPRVFTLAWLGSSNKVFLITFITSQPKLPLASLPSPIFKHTDTTSTFAQLLQCFQRCIHFPWSSSFLQMLTSLLKDTILINLGAHFDNTNMLSYGDVENL